jgi:hypothetical protein
VNDEAGIEGTIGVVWHSVLFFDRLKENYECGVWRRGSPLSIAESRAMACRSFTPCLPHGGFMKQT